MTKPEFRMLFATQCVRASQEGRELVLLAAGCPVRHRGDVLAGGVKSRHLPALLVDVSSLCAKLRYGYGYGDMRPIDSLADNDVPILFMHGADDAFIPPEHSERMREATRGYGEVHLIANAGHAQSVLVNPVEYEACVRAFLGRIGAESGADAG